MAGLMASLAGLFVDSTAPAEEKTATEPVRIGAISSLFRDAPPSLIPTLIKPLTTVMHSQTGLVASVSIVGDAEDLGGQLAADKLDLAIFNGFEYAWAKNKQPSLKPLLLAVSQDRNLKAFLVVRGDSGVQNWSDLQNKRVALPRFSREHSRLFLERRCLNCGQPADRFFAHVTAPGDIYDALDDVIDGKVNGTIVDSVGWEAFRKSKPVRASKLKVAISSETFPTGVIAYHPGGVGDSVIKRFHDGMLRANTSEKGQQMLTLCRITGFEDVSADFEQLCTDIARTYPPPSMLIHTPSLGAAPK
jgi:ABC-type phosphate/phosphonate transport system substrate-binding protein